MPVPKSLSLALLSTIVIIVIVIAVIVYVPKLTYSPKGNYSVAMAGRSVMGMWFRYWNIPSILNKLSIYKPWPVPFKKYQKGGVFLEYIPMEPPHRGVKDKGYEFGQEMYRTLKQQIDGKKYDALFFKYCFVEFDDRSIISKEKADKRFDEMTLLAKKVHKLAVEKKMKLILGNSLPSLKPGKFNQELRYRFNDWVDEYSSENKDVVMLDLFNPLIDSSGKLKEKYSIDLEDSDPHPNMEAFELVEEQLFHKIQQIKNAK